MNGLQQRTHKSHRDQQLKDLATILQELDERIVELARIVEVLDHRTVDLGKGTAEAYNALADTVGQLQTTTRDDLIFERQLRQREIDAAMVAVSNEERIRNDLRDSVWRRVRWFVRGY